MKEKIFEAAVPAREVAENKKQPIRNSGKYVILIILAVFITVTSIYWTPNVILCVPAFIIFLLSVFKSEEKNKSNNNEGDHAHE